MALQMTWQQRSLQPRRKFAPPLGLKNLGNTCYLNSVLQCLTFTPPLAQFCLSSQHSSLCKELFVNRERECPFCILERQIARSLSLEGPLDTPSKIQKCLTLFAENFRWGRQEDAHEFLRYVIDACHNTCLKLLKRLPANPKVLPPPPAKESAAEGGPLLVMKEIFGGSLLSQVKCLSCKGESNTTDEIMDISLDLFQSNSLKDALGRYFQPEVLDGSNKYNCQKCKKLSVAKKQLFMLRAPNVLVIQLKRFEGIPGGKINRNIEFEEVLVLSKFMYDTSQDLQPEYNLFGSIVHSGFSQDSGHYYAYIKDAFGRWYCCNDAHVSLSSTKEVLSEKVYILFYIRNNESPRPSKTGSLCNGVKSSDSNGSCISPFQKPVELLKQPPVKPNGVLSSTMLNSRMSPGLQIKPISLKNVEFKRVTGNGKGNLEIGQSKKDKILIEYSSMDGSKMVDSAKVSSAAKGNTTDDKVEHNEEQKLSVPNGVGHNDLLKGEVDEHNGNQIVAAVNGEPDCHHSSNHNKVEHNEEQKLSVPNGVGRNNLLIGDLDERTGTQIVEAVKMEPDRHHSSNHMINKYTYGVSNSKRKLCDFERAEVPVLSTKETCGLSTNGVRKYSQEEIEKLKEMLAREARSTLQSCDWADRVHKFMRTRKKLCSQSIGRCPDNDELRKQLKNDAKKDFPSQIPESLKAHLIQRLTSFYNGKFILDA